jgi:hypothetical protein
MNSRITMSYSISALICVLQPFLLSEFAVSRVSKRASVSQTTQSGTGAEIPSAPEATEEQKFLAV